MADKSKEKEDEAPEERWYEKEEKAIPAWKIWKRRRNIVSQLAFFGFFAIYVMRVNLSIATTAMTENKTIVLEDGSITYQQEFDWDSTKSGYLLSAFFYGYITTQFVGGYFAEKYGGKKFFGIGIFVTAILNLFTPLVAKASYEGLLAVRVIQGMFEGVIYPSIYVVLARWAPPLERSRLATLAFSGGYFGAVMSMSFGGTVAEKWGWESVFYIFGCIPVVWFAFWMFFVGESPSEDRFITERELSYISAKLNKGKDEKRNVKHPWKSILTSMPVWAMVVSNFSANWGLITLLTQVQTFMKVVLDFDLSASGNLALLPYLLMANFTVISGIIADKCLERKWLNTTQVRKIFNCVAFVFQTVFMIATVFLMSAIGSALCLSLAVGFGGFALSGYGVNYLDIGPSHASVVMGISNTFATLPGIISPMLTDYIVPNNTEDEWRNVFYIAAAIYLFGCIFYGIFASGQLQPWSWEAQNLKKNESDTGNEEYQI